MNESAVNYAVIRYRPMPETGEFANIGVVAIDARSGRIAYKLSARRFRRVTQFFENIPSAEYSNLIHFMDSELSRMAQISQIRSPATGMSIFHSFVGRHEGAVIFSAVRSVLSSDLDDTVGRLFDKLVRRNSEATPQREVKMVRSIRDHLHQENIYAFKSRQIDDDLMPVRLPLVSDKKKRAVIKPLAFDQKSTLAMIDHASVWSDRFSYLIDRGVFSRENVLFTVEGPPSSSEEPLNDAFDVAMKRIHELKVEVIECGNRDVFPEALVDFARRSAGPEPRLFN